MPSVIVGGACAELPRPVPPMALAFTAVFITAGFLMAAVAPAIGVTRVSHGPWPPWQRNHTTCQGQVRPHTAWVGRSALSTSKGVGRSALRPLLRFDIGETCTEQVGTKVPTRSTGTSPVRLLECAAIARPRHVCRRGSGAALSDISEPLAGAGRLLRSHCSCCCSPTR